jgi:hypothetical protein
VEIPAFGEVACAVGIGVAVITTVGGIGVGVGIVAARSRQRGREGNVKDTGVVNGRMHCANFTFFAK